MGVDFRCEKCGKQITGIDGKAGSTVKCPHCQKKVTVPAATAAMARPQVPGNSAPPPDGPPPEPVSPEVALAGLQDVVTGDEREDVMVSVVAKIMPWLISVFLHLGIAMLALFLVIFSQAAKAMTTPPEAPEGVTIPEAELSENPNELGSSNPGMGSPDIETKQSVKRVDEKRGWATREGPGTTVGIDTGQTGEKLEMFGTGGGASGSEGGQLAAYGLAVNGGSGAPRSGFLGTKGNAYHIVWVIDRSGSMVTEGVFETVKMEMIKSISKLVEKQDFHIILFSDNKPLENGSQGLVIADSANKQTATRFLDVQIAEGKTDPVPALQRAFDVMEHPVVKGKGKLIYLLTDGAFPDNDAVLKVIREKNAKKEILVNTFLYSHEPGEAQKVMKTIADENGGRYKLITEDE